MGFTGVTCGVLSGGGFKSLVLWFLGSGSGLEDLGSAFRAQLVQGCKRGLIFCSCFG